MLPWAVSISTLACPSPVTRMAPTVSARGSRRSAPGRPLVVEDPHPHLVVPPAVVQDRLAPASLLDEARLLVGADPGRVERDEVELDPLQPHLAEAVVDDDPHRVGAVAAADVLAPESDADRRAPV